ncbi:MAG: phosphotransferase family protein [Candidatus Thorarchaeota archaeon]|jgi:aminoglycoside phosphotransferase (APT) family kinase protein
MEKLRSIPGYSEWTDITPIARGYSEEAKFRVKIPSGEYYLVRISDNHDFDERKEEFLALKQLPLTHLNITRPVDFGLPSSGDFVYSIFSWIEGDEARLEIPKFSPTDQYEYGRTAGIILREIHKHPAPLEAPHWGQRFRQKIERNIKLYHELGIHLDYGPEVIEFLRRHVHLLDDRPQSLQHGDFHLGNMVLTKQENADSRELGLIDFNRISYGDPWEEFERCYFIIQKSVPFMNGQIHGYFDDDVPDLFLKLMAFYTGYSCVGSIPWTKPFGPEEMEKTRILSNSVIEEFNNYQDYVPKWYEEP